LLGVTVATQQTPLNLIMELMTGLHSMLLIFCQTTKKSTSPTTFKVTFMGPNFQTFQPAKAE
jgi:hypothetical protein